MAAILSRPHCVFVFVFDELYLYLYLYLIKFLPVYLHLYLYLKLRKKMYLYLYLIKRIWPQPCLTQVFCPQLIRNLRTRRRIDRFSIFAPPPANFYVPWERSLKLDAKNSICVDIYWYKQFDNRYGFSISIGNTNIFASYCHIFQWTKWVQPLHQCLYTSWFESML